MGYPTPSGKCRLVVIKMASEKDPVGSISAGEIRGSRIAHARALRDKFPYCSCAGSRRGILSGPHTVY